MMEEALRRLSAAISKLETAGDVMAAFMASPFMLVLANQTHFVQVNDRWTIVLGWSREELLGRPWRDFIHPEDLERTEKAAQVMEYEPLLGMFKNRYSRKGGGWITLWWVASPWTAQLTYAVAMPVLEESQK